MPSVRFRGGGIAKVKPEYFPEILLYSEREIDIL